MPDAAIAHLLEQNPHLKFILLLRDPIARTWSDIRMSLRQPENAGVTPQEMWTSWPVREPDNYCETLDKWRRHCGPDNIFISFLDIIAARPFVLLQKLCHFLEIPFDGGYFPRARAVVHGDSQPVNLPTDLYNVMRDHYREVILQLAAEFPDPCAQWAKEHFG